MGEKQSVVDQISDGCHKYGWVITVILNAIILAFFMGAQNQKIEDMTRRLARLEAQFDAANAMKKMEVRSLQ